MRRRRVVITIRKMVSAVHMDVLVRSEWGREERRACATCELIDEESANQSADESYKCSNRDGGGWLAERDASDKDDRFYAWFAVFRIILASRGVKENIYLHGGL